MSDDAARIQALEAENERLRDLLLENDIDPDPQETCPLFRIGPPTAEEQAIIDMLTSSNEFFKHLPFLEEEDEGKEFVFRTALPASKWRALGTKSEE